MASRQALVDNAVAAVAAATTVANTPYSAGVADRTGFSASIDSQLIPLLNLH